MDRFSASGKASSIPAGLAWGVSVSTFSTLLLSAVLTFLIDKGKMSWESIGYGIMCILLFSSFVGAKVSYRRIKRQRLMVSVMFAVLYLGVLMSATALFFGGQYDGVGVSALLVFGGSVTSALLRKDGKRAGDRGKTRLRTR